jgi:hypothetical protein
MTDEFPKDRERLKKRLLPRTRRNSHAWSAARNTTIGRLPTRSHTKWQSLKIATAAANGVSNTRYLIPTTIEHEPHRCSRHTVLKPEDVDALAAFLECDDPDLPVRPWNVRQAASSATAQDARGRPLGTHTRAPGLA